SGQHVLVATMLSKSVLRSAAAAVAQKRRYVDYFPSFEIINAAPFKGMFFEPNLRNVNPAGVRIVMEHFFAGQKSKVSKKSAVTHTDAVCEEELLAAFGERP
ncbi:MAG: GSCFA domain-containing protein, partial [Gammaproteobacteria bacterium]|nr:GSCFA domain-containing protein [Gammaproteobacteria bacterium]